MPNVTINPPGTINVRVGTAVNPKVSALTYGGRNLKDAADLELTGIADGDFITYQANTNSFVMESLGHAVYSMSLIGNVDTTNLVNGSVLIYKASTQKWVSTTTLEEQNLEGGHY